MDEKQPTKHSRELQNAIYDDWKRKVVDDAKKRAVGQAVDYDTFKNMVSVAHLKPIQAPKNPKTDMMLPSWRFDAEGAAAPAAVSEAGSAAAALLQREPSELPSTSGDFLREWRRNCSSPDAKYRYLRLCGPATLSTLFKVEINCELLKDLLSVLESCWRLYAGTAEDTAEGSGILEANFVIQVLQALQTAGRFQLTMKLLGAAARKVLESLLSQLDEAIQAAASSEVVDASAAADVGTDQAAPAAAAGAAGGWASQGDVQALRAAYGL